MSDPPELGDPPERITVTAEQVRRLIAGQFPQWADQPVEPVAQGGWDNQTFRLGAGMVVRLPSAAEYAQAVEKEQRWLPALAPRLPLPIPVPLALGAPTVHYPYPWSVYRWIDGVSATRERIADPVAFAVALAGFLAALQDVDPTDGPQPGVHNWYRGGSLRTYDRNTRRALKELDGRLDVELAGEIWAGAMDARWDGVDRWFHGDIAEGNLLLAEGRLTAVIDFGTCGVGDPACDLAVAWTLLTPGGRRAFRDRLAVDDATWVRGRGWALWKAIVTCGYSYDDPDGAATFRAAERIIDDIIADHRGTRPHLPTTASLPLLSHDEGTQR